MSTIKSVMDTYYSTRFTKLMVQRFTQWDAFRHGIIDNKGNLLRKPQSSREKASYTRFHALVRSVKQTIQKFGGQSATAAIASKAGWDALKESYGEYKFDNVIIEHIEFEEETEDLQNLREAVIAGDSGGNADNIAKGVTSGDVTGPGPDVLGKKRKKKKKIAKES